MNNRLTVKQENFICKYIECGNASEAYRFAYDCRKMKRETIHVKASELLSMDKISVRIRQVQSEVAKELLVSDGSVLKEMSKIAFSDIRNLFDPDGRLKRSKDFDANTATAIASMKVVTRNIGGGEVE